MTGFSFEVSSNFRRKGLKAENRKSIIKRGFKYLFEPALYQI